MLLVQADAQGGYQRHVHAWGHGDRVLLLVELDAEGGEFAVDVGDDEIWGREISGVDLWGRERAGTGGGGVGKGGRGFLVRGNVLPCASSMISAELSAHFPFMVRDSALPVWVLVKVAVALLPITGEELSARVPSLISSLPLVRSEIVAASIPTHPAPAYPLSFPPPQPKENPTLTFHTTPHLHNLPPARILNRKRSMQMELLLHNIKQMRALHIEHLLAAREAHPLRLDAQYGGSVSELDEVVVPG